MEENWFRSITLKNVRSFSKRQTINFTQDNGKIARWNILLGDNGTGKTTILKCLALLHYFKRDSFNLRRLINPQYFYRNLGSEPFISLSFDVDYKSGLSTKNLYFLFKADQRKYSW